MKLSARTELEPHVRYITADWELRACVRGPLPGGGILGRKRCCEGPYCAVPLHALQLALQSSQRFLLVSHSRGGTAIYACARLGVPGPEHLRCTTVLAMTARTCVPPMSLTSSASWSQAPSPPEQC